jgi:cation diffusion facilitator family transporter
MDFIVKDTSPRVRQITWIGIWVNLVLSIVKITAGILGSSKALIADGLESATDIFTSFALIVGSKYWSAPPDSDHPYGHRRIETIMTLGVGVIVGIVGVSITWNAVASLHTGEHSHPNLLALGGAIASVIFKELLFQWSVREGKKIKSMAVVANAWHHRSDAISSIPVVIAVGCAQFLPAWSFLDALGALIAAAFILKASVAIIWPALREIADTGASEKTVQIIHDLAASVPGVQSIHALRTRFVGSSIHVDLHIVVDPKITVMEGHQIGDAVTDILTEKGPEVIEVLVHLDPRDDS